MICHIVAFLYTDSSGTDVCFDVVNSDSLVLVKSLQCQLVCYFKESKSKPAMNMLSARSTDVDCRLRRSREVEFSLS